MKPYIIAFSGKARVGKDTSASIVSDILKPTNMYHVERRAFADKLKQVANDLFFWGGNKEIYPEEKKDLGRNLLINIGQKMREIRQDVWIDYVLENIRDDIRKYWLRIVETKSKIYLITDLRYKNEALLLKDFKNRYNINVKVILIRLDRPGSLHLDTTSEIDLDNYDGFDYTVKTRDNDLLSLKENLAEILIKEELLDAIH